MHRVRAVTLLHPAAGFVDLRMGFRFRACRLGARFAATTIRLRPGPIPATAGLLGAIVAVRRCAQPQAAPSPRLPRTSTHIPGSAATPPPHAGNHHLADDPLRPPAGIQRASALARDRDCSGQAVAPAIRDDALWASREPCCTRRTGPARGCDRAAAAARAVEFRESTRYTTRNDLTSGSGSRPRGERRVDGARGSALPIRVRPAAAWECIVPARVSAGLLR